MRTKVKWIEEGEKPTKEATDNPTNTMAGVNMDNLPDAQQLSLFQLQDPAALEAAEMLRDLEPNAMTPVEALLKLVELKKIVGEE